MNRRERREATALLSRVLQAVDSGDLAADGPAAVAIVRRLEGALLAVESALRDRLAVSEKPSLATLVERARGLELIDREGADLLDVGRRLRNDLLHSHHQGAWTPALAAPVLATSHRLVVTLYPEPTPSNARDDAGRP